MRQRLFRLTAILIFTAIAGMGVQAFGQSVDDSGVSAGEYDNGKMWTFDYPPVQHLRDTYDFEPGEAWFEKARLGSLRLPNCTASFVSPRGLVMTNNHCGRGSVAQVSQPGENLLDNGFTAGSLDEERLVEGLYVDQLVAIEDVTDEIYAALQNMETDAEKAVARQEAIQAAAERIQGSLGGEDAGFVVQVINLYNGGRYSAYTFRRYSDLRLVMTPELQLGYFGGDTDNFTYPRYALDMTFFRVYEDGQPYEPEHYFKWSENGSKEGDVVFVIGNPGSTLRLETLAQLEFRRDVQEKSILALYDSRIEVLELYYEENPSDQLRNQIFGMKNAQKLYRGRVKGLNDPVIMAKRADTERQFLNDLQDKYANVLSDDVQVPYLTLIQDLAEIQDQKLMYAAEFGSFLAFQPGSPYASSTMQRAALAASYVRQMEATSPGGALDQLKQQVLNLPYQDQGLDQRMLEARLHDFVAYFGEDDPGVLEILGDRSILEVAQNVMVESVLTDQEKLTEAMEAGTLGMDDPGIRLIAPFLDRRRDFQSAFSGLSAQESELNAQHGRARFDIYGTSRPPDATFSIRITDGVVKSYEYNGSHAPAYTTFYGLYNRYFSHERDVNGTKEWVLPERWVNAPATFDRSTPMNLVTTSDIIGGNSGSPMLNKDLEVIGLIFDGNIESLPSAFIYQTEVARAVGVDSRGMLEALDEVYDMDRIVLELTTGQLVPTEAEADALNR